MCNNIYTNIKDMLSPTDLILTWQYRSNREFQGFRMLTIFTILFTIFEFVERVYL